MKVASFFAGVGGIDLAFKNAGCSIVFANEIDEKAVKTLKENHIGTKILQADIKGISMELIPNHDILLAGFPCQAFSIAGHRRGFNDERGELFFDLLKIIKNKKPNVVFLENVKNLISHDSGNTFKVILESLIENGYHVKYQVLNAKEYGNIPQNRERIYIVAFKNFKEFEKFVFPEKIKLTNTIDKVIDFNRKIDRKFYYGVNNFKHFELLSEGVKKENTVYQWRRHYVRENKSGVCPTLTANMGTGGHNVPIIKTKYGIRKLTPQECFDLQGFPENFKLPDFAMSHLYKQAGNSVVVSVVERIANQIMIALGVK